MKKILLTTLCAGLPNLAYGLGVGDIQTQSHLNSPFRAMIPLINHEGIPFERINASLASLEAFKKAGLERHYFLSKLTFSVIQQKDGQAFIEIKSKPSIQEPFLSFMVEVNWPEGSLVREYTVLLDPPVLNPVNQSIRALGIETNPTSIQLNAPMPNPMTSGVTVSQGLYGPVRVDESLWSIAHAITPPGQGISINQTMMALYDKNPHAFVNGDMNKLMKGYTLVTPSFGEISRVDHSKADTTIQEQDRQFEEYRLSQILSQGELPTSSTSSLRSGHLQDGHSGAIPETPSIQLEPTSIEASANGLLKLIVNNEDEINQVFEGDTLGQITEEKPQQDSAKVTEFIPQSSEVQTLYQQLALNEESLDVVSRENQALRSEVTTLNDQIQSLRSLLELTNTKLAELQQLQVGSSAPLKDVKVPRASEPTSIESAESSYGLIFGLLAFFTLLFGLLLGYLVKMTRQYNDLQVKLLAQHADATHKLHAGEDTPMDDIRKTEPNRVESDVSKVLPEGLSTVRGLAEVVEPGGVNDANELIAQQDFVKAKDILINVLDKHPYHVGALVSLMNLYKHTQSLEAFEKRVAAIPNKIRIQEPLSQTIEEVRGYLENQVSNSASENIVLESIIEPGAADAIDMSLKSVADKDEGAGVKPIIPKKPGLIMEQSFNGNPDSSGGLRLVVEDTETRAPNDDGFELDTEDKNATKLDLARAFIDMNSIYNARLMLNQVISEGTDSQVSEAKELLKRT